MSSYRPNPRYFPSTRPSPTGRFGSGSSVGSGAGDIGDGEPDGEENGEGVGEAARSGVELEQATSETVTMPTIAPIRTDPSCVA